MTSRLANCLWPRYINRAGFGESRVFSAAEIETIDGAFREALAGHAALLDRRAGEGRIRRCHGDLHLRNICLWQGKPRLFDCIDFNDRLATIDVLYDLAFMAMDLWPRACPTARSGMRSSGSPQAVRRTRSRRCSRAPRSGPTGSRRRLAPRLRNDG
ncbi:phosphotransferase [Mangrovicoccus ximenensis]|uniref:phosphotransferase n=1 Tax=Mangrovicoccus ximenensis TaxID=1911570 RepID=UPI000D374748|nr:phosphotransferase [Mangrovicoccus ximenensis]